MTAWVRGARAPTPPARLGDEADRALPRCGVFVSLHRQGALRGCIGHVVGDAPLCDLVEQMAVAAARDDPRFPPLAPEELEGLDVELSLLSSPRPVRPADVVPGEHGVIVRSGTRMGVFLPQVASEQGWDRETLLDQLCRKAGLPPDAWRSGGGGARLEAFTTQLVRETPR